MSKKIILFSGDPNSINSEIIYKSWKLLNNSLKKRIYILSNYALLKDQFKKLNYKVKIIKVKNIDEKSNNHDMKIINIDINFKNTFKIDKKNTSIF